MRTKLAFLIALVIVCVGVVFFCIKTPCLSKFVLRRAVQAIGPDVVIREIGIARQHVFASDRVEYTDIVVAFDRSGTAYRLECPKLTVEHALAVFFKDRGLHVSVEGLTAHFGPGRIRDAGAELDVDPGIKGPLSFRGALTSGEIAWDRAAAGDITANVAGDAQGAVFEDVRGSAFGGRFAGRVELGFVSPWVYGVWMDGQDIDTAKLADLGG